MDKSNIIFLLKSRKAWANFLIFFCFVLFGCIREIEVFKANNPTLIIEGVVTNAPGPHTVKLAMSKAYNEEPDYSRVERAHVVITDDLGNEEILGYTERGVYKTSETFSGVVGRSYSVTVALEDGATYQSLPELLTEAPPITDLQYQMVNTQLDFTVDFQDTPGKDNFYRWRYRGTYEVKAPLAYELSLTNEQMKNSKCIIWDGVPPMAADIWRCWVNHADNEFLKLEQDELFDGKMINDYPVVSLDLDRKFDRGYSLEISSYSLTEEAFRFWKALEDQIGNNGTIFETSNYQIRGNIRSINDPNEIVLGYFGASGVSTARVNVLDYLGTFGDVPCGANNAGCFPQRCLDCTKFAANATTTRPPFWPI